MKHKTFIIIALTLLSASAKAQYESALARELNIIPNAEEFTVVRNHKETSTFSVHFDKRTRITRSNYGDYYSHNLGGSLDLELTDSLDDFFINDMTIVDDYAFFCGCRYVQDILHPDVRTAVEGMIGYFLVTDFFVGNVLHIEYHCYTDIQRFDKLVAYQDNVTGLYKVVALGIKSALIGGLNYTVNAIVEYDDFLGNVPSANPYFIPSFFPAAGPREEVHSILLTKDNVVLVGYDFANDWLCIRKAPRNNVLNSNSLDTLYYYNTWEREVVQLTQAEVLVDDTIAVTYVYNPYDETFRERIRVIETSKMDMINSQEFTMYDKNEVIDLEYIPNVRQLVLLHPGIGYTYGCPYNHFILIEPFNYWPYSTNYLFHKQYNGWYTSLHSFGGDDYVATGYNRWHYQRIPPTYSTTFSCYDYEPLDIDIIQNVDVGMILHPGLSQPSLHYTTPGDYNITPEMYTVDCEM